MSRSFRPATSRDVEGQHSVFCAAEAELYERHGFDPSLPSLEGFRPLCDHLLAHDADRCFVAEADGEVVGFSAAIVRGDVWFLSMLFVHPQHQGAGVGRRLLELCWGSGHGRRLTITDSIQPVSNGLYASRGLIPATPMLGLEGEPRIDVEEPLEPAPVDAASLGLVDSISYGFDRAVDHAYWARTKRATLWRRDGTPVAYSYVTPEGGVGPVAGVDAAAAAQALRCELARSAGRRVTVCIAGSAAEMVSVALRAGLRFTAPPGFLLETPPAALPRNLAIASYGLF